MPWHVDDNHPDCSGFAVVKDDDGSVEGCHETREQANRQVAALYANESEVGRAQMTAARINDLPDSAFAYIEPGGSKDESGKTVPRSKRHFPIHDAAHVRNALARAPQSPFGDKAMPKIKAAAKKFGVGEDDDNSRNDHLLDVHRAYVRSFPLEDARIRSGDGRTVEAYAAVFDVPTEIRDQDGRYNEVIDRVAFNRAISDAAPQGNRSAWRVGVFYNHGRTLYGTPSERASMPVGTPLEIKADTRGLFTVTQYHRTELADEVLESIRSGSLPGYSFQGSFRRSTAVDHAGRNLNRVPRGGFRPSADGQLVTVRRMESSLREYGPTPFPAYELAEVVGMRAEQAAVMLNNLDPQERAQLVELLRDGALLDAPDGDSSDDSPTIDAPSDEGLVSDDSPTPEVGRSSREALLQRIAVAKTTRPGLFRDRDAEQRRLRAEAIVGRKGS
jgi:phage head maturation protease